MAPSDPDKTRENLRSLRKREQQALRQFVQAARRIVTFAESSHDLAFRGLGSEVRVLLDRSEIKLADTTTRDGPSPTTTRAAAADAMRALAPVLETLADALDMEADPAAVEHSAAFEWIRLRDTGISMRTLRAAIRVGHLPASRVGTHLRVRRADLEKWLDGRRVEPQGAHDSRTPAETSPTELSREQSQRGGSASELAGRAR